MLCLAFAAGLEVGCGGSDSTAPRPPTAPPPNATVDLSGEWTAAAPEAEGVDPARLAASLTQAAALPGLRSLLVIRHGRLVAERYFVSGGTDSLYSVRSVTKSVTALLVGLALERGIIRDTAATLADFFHPPLPALDAAHGALTVENLLTMTGGFQWDESSAAGYNAWALAPDQLDYLLARPIVTPPGSRFNYNSAAVHLLAAVIGVASGKPDGTGADAFADRELLLPLGVTRRDWEYDDRGIPNGGAGLLIRPRDMAKIGQLVLQNGVSGTRTLVSTHWIQECIRSHVATGTTLGPLGRLDYGQLWWLGQLGGRRVILAWGYGGQFIYIVPALDLVVVTTATWQGLGDGAYPQAAAIMTVVANAVTAAAGGTGG